MKLRTRLRVMREIVRDLLGLSHRDAILSTKDSALFFSDGWGNLDQIESMRVNRLLEAEPASLDVEWHERIEAGGFIRKTASFPSPMPKEFLPEGARTVHVKLILPQDHHPDTPIVILFPMTGDEGYQLREDRICEPLLKQGIGTLILEGPFYGKRRPEYQKTYFFNTVHDLLAMCLASALEGRAMLKELRARGFRRLGVAGQSQGGMVAAVVNSLTPFPIFAGISLAAHAPDVILTDGLLRSFVNWAALEMPSLERTREKFQEIFEVGDVLLRPQPAAPQSAFLQGGRRDMVAPAWSIQKLHEHWKGSQLEWLPGSHVSSIAWHAHDFVDLIARAAKSLDGRIG